MKVSKDLDVRFRYDRHRAITGKDKNGKETVQLHPRQTTAVVKFLSTDQEFSGSVKLWHKDRFVRREGRKEALRALFINQPDIFDSKLINEIMTGLIKRGVKIVDWMKFLQKPEIEL